MIVVVGVVVVIFIFITIFLGMIGYYYCHVIISAYFYSYELIFIIIAMLM
jgi:hypothetical protein